MAQLTIKERITDARKIPMVGRRKKFRINGHVQLLTLNELSVERTYDWGAFGKKGEPHAYFDVTQEWGEFHNV